ncbi:MAG: chromosome partitioning protein ParB [Geminicoccus sp.]|nr:chromosome partitioning protein ParB [Geminicoccus sp.]
MAQKGLGRGLSALFEDENSTDGGPSAQQLVAVTDLSPSPFQPRQIFDPERLDELAASIRSQGVIQPLLVRQASEGVKTRYEIIAGERRWRAAQRARLHEVPVIIRPLSNVDAAEIAVLENIQREDLSLFEEAEGYRRLITQFSYTQAEVAERVGKSRAHIANTLRLLAMPDQLRRMVEEGQLSAGHARALLSVENPIPLARQAVAERWSVRELEQAVRRLLTPSERREGAPAVVPGQGEKDPDLREAEEQATSQLGLSVQIQGSGTKGQVRVSYASLEQLELILAKLSGSP